MKWEDVDGKVGSAEMLNAAEWKLVAEIDEGGNVSYIMSSDQHKEDFKLKPTPWSEKFSSCR